MYGLLFLRTVFLISMAAAFCNNHTFGLFGILCFPPGNLSFTLEGTGLKQRSSETFQKMWKYLYFFRVLFCLLLRFIGIN